MYEKKCLTKTIGENKTKRDRDSRWEVDAQSSGKKRENIQTGCEGQWKDALIKEIKGGKKASSRQKEMEGEAE